MLSNFKKIFNESKYKLLLELFAVAFGVLLAVQVDNMRKESEINDVTMTKLSLFVVEFDFNISQIERIQKCYLRYDATDSLDISVLDDFCARNLFEDDNIYNTLEPEIIYLIRDYLNNVKELNYLNQLYIENYTSSSLKNPYESENFKENRKLIVMKCKILLAVCMVISQELIGVIKENKSKGEKLKNFRKRVNEQYELNVQH